MRTKRAFRIKLEGEGPRRATVTSRLWLASIDPMSLPGGYGRPPMTLPAGQHRLPTTMPTRRSVPFRIG